VSTDRRRFLKSVAASAAFAAPAVNRDFWTSAYQAIDD